MYIPEPFASEFANLQVKEKVYILMLTIILGCIALGFVVFIS